MLARQHFPILRKCFLGTTYKVMSLVDSNLLPYYSFSPVIIWIFFSRLTSYSVLNYCDDMHISTHETFHINSEANASDFKENVKECLLGIEGDM